MAEILFATSYDDRNSPQNILAQDNTVWTSTGLYPQEIFIQMPSDKPIGSASVQSWGVKKLAIETCENDSCVNFLKQGEKADIPHKEEGMQEYSITFSQPKGAKVVKVIVLEGYDNFCAIRNISFK
jgi:hypothetical protein